MARDLWDASYLDGRTPTARRTLVRITRAALVLAVDGAGEIVWPLAEVRQTQGFHAGEHVRLERGGEVSEALVVTDQAFVTSLRELAPEAAAAFVDPVRRRRRAALVVAAAAGVVGLVAALYFVGIPALAGVVTERVPPSWEARLGASVVDELAPPGRRCGGAGGAAGLDAVMRRLVDHLGPTPYAFRVVVSRDPAVNAFALPGGHLIVLQGLLAAAESPEELAGVLAHEVQHVVRRHATRQIIEHAGLAVLVTAIAGDPSGVAAIGVQAARTLAAARYTRTAEDEADRGGVRLLLAAGIDPQGMIRFFERLARTEGRAPAALAYLSSHPRTEERVRTLRALAAGAAAPRGPLLEPEAWEALRRICGPAG